MRVCVRVACVHVCASSYVTIRSNVEHISNLFYIVIVASLLAYGFIVQIRPIAPACTHMSAI